MTPDTTALYRPMSVKSDENHSRESRSHLIFQYTFRLRVITLPGERRFR
jgi:hypothetical protein